MCSCDCSISNIGIYLFTYYTFQELYEVHLCRSPEASMYHLVSSCPDCGQILARRDAEAHRQMHSKDQDFPMLG